MAKGRPRSPLQTPRWQRFRRHLIDSTPHPVCALCGNSIDTALKWPDPRSVTVDHRVPVTMGGAVFDPANCQLAHKRCNESKGTDGVVVPTPSRDW